MDDTIDGATLEFGDQNLINKTIPPSDSFPAISPAQQIASRYEIIGLIGSGGMGNVYKVRDLVLDETVALKTLHPSLNQNVLALSRFKREVKLARKVTHPNVARTFDLGMDSTTPYLTMEYVEGQTLYNFINIKCRQRVRINPIRSLDIAIEIAKGLEAAHEAGVIHRDLKPANIILTPDERVVITDFGIARVTESQDVITAVEGMVGTPLYMSPEQVESEHDIDHRTDLYALGVILFEMLAGRPPFTGENAVSLALARILKAPPSLADEGYPAGVADLVAQMLARDPSDRYQSAAALIQAITQLKIQLSSLSITSSVAVQVPSSTPQYEDHDSQQPSHKSLAIIPLKKAQAACDNEHLVEGFLEELVGELSIAPNIRVRPTGVVKSLLEENDLTDPVKIGKLLGVDVVVTGSVRDHQDNLRIRLSLISVNEGFQIWGKKFMTSAADLFITAEDASEAIANALTSKVEEHKRPEALTDPVAVDTYMRGRYLLQLHWFHGVQQAIDKFTIARDRAPNDPRILTSMAVAISRQVFFEPHKASVLLIQAKSYAQRASELVPNWPEPYHAMAMIAYAAGDYSTTIKSCQHALNLAPEHIEAHDLLGRVLAEVGPLEEARYHLERALALNETLYRAWWDLLRVYGLQGQWDKINESLPQVRKSTRLNNALESFLFRLHCWQGLPINTFSFKFDLDAADPRFEIIFASITKIVNEHTLSKEYLEDLYNTARQMPARSQSARIFLQLCAEFALSSGEYDIAYQAVESALQEGLRDLMWLQHMPLLNPLRCDPRFQDLLTQAQMTLAPVRATLTPHPIHSS